MIQADVEITQNGEVCTPDAQLLNLPVLFEPGNLGIFAGSPVSGSHSCGVCVLPRSAGKIAYVRDMTLEYASVFGAMRGSTVDGISSVMSTEAFGRISHIFLREGEIGPRGRL